MTTTVKLAGIAALTFGILFLKWAVAHTFTLALIFATLATVAVVAGPAIKTAKAKLSAKQAPKAVTAADDIDWSAAVLNYKLPTNHEDA